MRSLTKVVVILLTAILLTAGISLMLKPRYQTRDETRLDHNQFITYLSLVDFISEFENNKSIYTDYENRTENFVKGRVIDKTYIGKKIIAEVEIVEVYKSGTMNVKDIIYVVEPYTLSNDLEYSNTVYIPMYVDQYYYLNVVESSIYDGHYNLLCDMFGVIKAEGNKTNIVFDGLLKLSVEDKEDIISFDIDVNKNKEELNAILGEVSPTFTEEYKAAKATIEKTIMTWINE